jgi:DNA polymerase III epsilon subunit-like protein
MSLLGVIDVETTGINPYRHDRIIEIAVVVITSDGNTVREFVTLVNPERDIGPSSIHGLTSRHIIGAPRFQDLAGAIVEILQGCVALGGHNVRFDRSFLEFELQRNGYSIPEIPVFCSMHLAGGGDLCSCCQVFGVAGPDVAHSALDDARATARLLASLLRDSDRLVKELSQLPIVKWPDVPKTLAQPVTREESRRSQLGPPRYLQRLLARLQCEIPPDCDDSAVLAYTALLDRVLEDRHIDEEEGESLIEVATKWGVTQAQVRDAHRDYVLRLSAAALADGVVTDAERRDLLLVADLLGIEQNQLEWTLEEAARKLHSIKQRTVQPTASSDGGFEGKRVCFTGEFQCRLGDEPITREMASELASRQGLSVADSVTKKLDILVVADPLTQSGKAKKARQYGVRIMHEPVFWKAIGVSVE